MPHKGQGFPRFDCNLGSAARLEKRFNEIVAIPVLGLRARHAHDNKSVLSAETTNKYFQNKIMHQTSRKKLEPYYPNAPRNRPKETLHTIVGNRFKLHPCIKHETYRGSSKIRFSDGNPDALRPWKTTNQVFAECMLVQDTVGMANSGISSDVAKYMRRKQGMYA
ncbi:hypothetical protein CVIRNUC_002056 [Coccomyxa viridis]|uniref:Uncharacterized protein n=1 Tax=Coccomyxa viridis TaxID=1274662 RepID=A0AAV1HXE2_9CHLO|nr:hypothetical protein CVIRNUC_002056 [Coccomyxa viridis]